jgi:uncharacterized protein with HEPN domain
MTADRGERLEALLVDVIEWSERCARHLKGVTREQFLEDEKTRDAVTKCVEVVGTAAKGVMETSPSLQREHPDIELQRAYAARIRLAHGYRGIDPQVLWMTATRSIPATAAAARRALEGLRSST